MSVRNRVLWEKQTTHFATHAYTCYVQDLYTSESESEKNEKEMIQMITNIRKVHIDKMEERVQGRSWNNFQREWKYQQTRIKVG